MLTRFFLAWEPLKSAFNLLCKMQLTENLISYGQTREVIASDISAILIGGDMRIREQESRDVISWRSPLHFWSKQNDHFQRRKEETGEWLLRDNVFKEWLNGIKLVLRACVSLLSQAEPI